MTEINPNNSELAANPYDQLGDLYNLWTLKVTDDVDFYLKNVRGGAKDWQAPMATASLADECLTILELGAGTGRISLQIAQDGHRVVAVDSSERLLSALRENASGDSTASALIDVIHGDMRAVIQGLASESFNAVIAPFRSFMHLTTDELVSLLAEAYRVLTPGGILAFDLAHMPEPIMLEGDTGWIFRANRTLDGVRWRFDERIIIDEQIIDDEKVVNYDHSESAREPLRLLIRCTPDGAADKSFVSEMLLHDHPALALADEMERIGFARVSLRSWFNEAPFVDGESTDSVFVARKSSKSLAPQPDF